MEKLNGFFDGIAKPLSGVADWLLRLGLGIAFFLHGYGKTDGFAGYLGSKGIPLPEVTAFLVTWGEMLAGIGIILGGVLAKSVSELGHLITRLSGGAIGIIMIFALLIAHSDWGIFFGERFAQVISSGLISLSAILSWYFFINFMHFVCASQR